MEAQMQAVCQEIWCDIEMTVEAGILVEEGGTGFACLDCWVSLEAEWRGYTEMTGSLGGQGRKGWGHNLSGDSSAPRDSGKEGRCFQVTSRTPKPHFSLYVIRNKNRKHECILICACSADILLTRVSFWRKSEEREMRKGTLDSLIWWRKWNNWVMERPGKCSIAEKDTKRKTRTL
jgi:hypothetical protein